MTEKKVTDEKTKESIQYNRTYSRITIIAIITFFFAIDIFIHGHLGEFQNTNSGLLFAKKTHSNRDLHLCRLNMIDERAKKASRLMEVTYSHQSAVSTIHFSILLLSNCLHSPRSPHLSSNDSSAPNGIRWTSFNKQFIYIDDEERRLSIEKISLLQMQVI